MGSKPWCQLFSGVFCPQFSPHRRLPGPGAPGREEPQQCQLPRIRRGLAERLHGLGSTAGETRPAPAPVGSAPAARYRHPRIPHWRWGKTLLRCQQLAGSRWVPGLSGCWISAGTGSTSSWCLQTVAVRGRVGSWWSLESCPSTYVPTATSPTRSWTLSAISSTEGWWPGRRWLLDNSEPASRPSRGEHGWRRPPNPRRALCAAAPRLPALLSFPVWGRFWYWEGRRLTLGRTVWPSRPGVLTLRMRKRRGVPA